MKSALLTPDEIRQVDAAIEAAESGTSAEVVVAVAPSSGPYWHVPYQGGVLGALLAAGVACALQLWIDGEWPHWHIGTFMLLMAIGFIGGALATRVPRIARACIGGRARQVQCRMRGRSVFLDGGVSATVGRTGVLIYVSLFERLVIVEGDAGVNAHMTKQDWVAIVGAMVGGLKQGKTAAALLEGLRMVGPLLAKKLPRAANDINELPNNVRLLG